MLTFGFVQSIINALVFSLRKPKHNSNFILCFWFLILSLFFLGLMVPKGLTAYIKIGFFPFFMLSGPVFYFYVRSLIDINFEFSWAHLVHSIPFVLVSFWRVIYLPESMSPAAYSGTTSNTIFFGIAGILALSVIGYWVATLLLLLRHQKNILNFFSDKSEKRSLNWVLLMMILTLLSHLIFFAAPFFRHHFSSIENMSFWLHQFNLGMLGYLLLIFGLLQPIIFEPELVSLPSKTTEEDNEKYYKSGLSKIRMQEYAKNIVEYLEKEKPYTNPEYSLQTMIRDLDISQQNLSQTINEVLGKNFYQLINEYRVREFQQLLQDPKLKNITFLGLAYEAGFNSKSSFNRIFKEITGQTPSQYRREL